MKKNQTNTPKHYPPLLTLIVSIAMIVIVILIAKSCAKESNSPPDKADVELYAPIMMKPAVESLLKAPASADFIRDGRSVYVNLTDSTAVVTGFVDAQNSFGAMIRTPYRVKLKYTGPVDDPGNWIALEAQLFE